MVGQAAGEFGRAPSAGVESSKLDERAAVAVGETDHNRVRFSSDAVSTVGALSRLAAIVPVERVVDQFLRHVVVQPVYAAPR